jgi:hypothetical protein
MSEQDQIHRDVLGFAECALNPRPKGALMDGVRRAF